MKMQRSKLRNFFTRGQGLAIRIDVPAILAGATKAYNRDSDELKNRFRIYGCFNWIDVVNNGTANLRVLLDGNMNRSIDTDFHERMTDAEFVEFVIVNESLVALDAGECVVYLGYKVNEYRSNFLADKILGGGR